MRANELNIRKEIIDGQLLYIPDISSWEIIFKSNPVIDGRKIVYEGHFGSYESDFKLLYGKFSIVKIYPCFSMAFYTTVPNRPWLICVLFKLQKKWQRVHIEQLTCEFCGWKGNTANPTLHELYIGVPNQMESIKDAWEIPVVPCPKCMARLPRYPIWTEPLKD